METPLLTRIKHDKPATVTLIKERMSPFMRRLAEKRLPTKVFYGGSWVPPGSDGAA